MCAALVGLLYWLLRGGWLEAILAGITLAMGILPQELPVIMIVFFAIACPQAGRSSRC
jgi:Ca2+-transporting ATPase